MLSELNPDKVIIAKYEELATQPKLTIPVILKVGFEHSNFIKSSLIIRIFT